MTAFSITEASITIYSQKFSLVTSHHTWNTRRGIILTLTDNHGYQGKGEAAPLPNYSTETFEECHHHLSKISPNKTLSIDTYRPLRQQIKTIVDETTISSNCPSALFAFETALVDLYRQHTQQSFTACLGEPKHKQLPLAAVISTSNNDELIQQTYMIAKRNIATIKLKIGALSFEQDKQRINLLIDSFSKYNDTPLSLRLDVNGAWNINQVDQYISQLVTYPIEYIEQPVSSQNLLSLKEQPIPIAVDESLYNDPSHRDALLSHFPIAILKPMRLGLFNTLDLAVMAQQHHVDIVMSHLFESPLGMTITAYLALLINSHRACGLAPHDALNSGSLPYITNNHAFLAF